MKLVKEKEDTFVNNKNPRLSFSILKVFLSLTFLFLFQVKLASAQFFDRYGYGYGSYGSISLSDIFNRLDPSTVFYVLLFFIIFTLLVLALSRASLFRSKGGPWGEGQPNATATGVVAFSISAMIVYYLYRTGYNLESFFYELGFSVDSFSFLLVIVFLVLAFLIIKKLGYSWFFIALGLFIIGLSFTNLIYERTTAIVIGLVIVGIGFLLRRDVREHTKDLRTH